MKKLLALALSLILTLGLASPALAAETPAEPTPEQIAEIMEKYGLEAPEAELDLFPDGDFGYSVKLPDPLLDEEYTYQDAEDEYAAYEAAHPEEIANLDAERLLADWGYVERTPEEWFLAYEGEYGETLEEAVRRTYIDRRQMVENACAQAEAYRADRPEMWENFDADSYFESEWLGYSDLIPDKAAYMARYNILTEDEFVDDMFAMYASEHYYDDYDYDSLPDPDDWWWDDVTPPDPTLALYVDGFAYEDVEIVAEDGVTYADAADLRGIFGEEAVPADKTGLLPIRETAQKAGWDVGWYGGGWNGEQEVQLWGKEGYVTALAEEFGPLNDFLAKAMKVSGNTLFAETPTSTHETVTVDLTRFSTLDGDKTYPLTFEVDAAMGGGVLDATVTFDVTELLKLFPADALESLTKLGGFSVTQLRQFLKAGVMEFIVDYNTGELAYNIPLLALADESLAGWQTETLPGLDGTAEAMKGLEEVSFTETLYAQLLNTAERSGAAYGLMEYGSVTDALSVFAGKDRFTTQNGKTTYSLTTEAANQSLTRIIADAADLHDFSDVPGGIFSFFKAFDITYTLDDSGNVTMELHIRPDTDGIAAAVAKSYESSYYFYDSTSAGVMEIVMNWALKGWNMDITASSQGSAQRSTGRMDIHWNNVGKVSVRTTAAQTGGEAPRNVEDVVK